MEAIPNTDEELRGLAIAVSQADFQQPFLHGCRYNPRLRSVGGRYLLKSHDIEINPRYAGVVGREGLIEVLRHELCHYHLHLQGRGYRHKDKEFRQLLTQVNGTRYAKRSALLLRPYRYEYRCKSCGASFFRKNRLNLRRYVCGKCEGRLQQLQEHGDGLMGRGIVLHE